MIAVTQNRVAPVFFVNQISADFCNEDDMINV